MINLFKISVYCIHSFDSPYKEWQFKLSPCQMSGVNVFWL